MSNSWELGLLNNTKKNELNLCAKIRAVLKGLLGRFFHAQKPNTLNVARGRMHNCTLHTYGKSSADDGSAKIDTKSVDDGLNADRHLPLGTWEITALEMPITSVQLFPQVGFSSVSSLTWLLTVTLGYGLLPALAAWLGMGNWVQFSGRKFDDEVSITDNATAAKNTRPHISKNHPILRLVGAFSW